jgi:hypothetical protein
MKIAPTMYTRAHPESTVVETPQQEAGGTAIGCYPFTPWPRGDFTFLPCLDVGFWSLFLPKDQLSRNISLSISLPIRYKKLAFNDISKNTKNYPPKTLRSQPLNSLRKPVQGKKIRKFFTPVFFKKGRNCAKKALKNTSKYHQKHAVFGGSATGHYDMGWTVRSKSLTLSFPDRSGTLPPSALPLASGAATLTQKGVNIMSDSCILSSAPKWRGNLPHWQLALPMAGRATTIGPNWFNIGS